MSHVNKFWSDVIMRLEDLIDSRYANSSDVSLSDMELYYCGLHNCPPLHTVSRVRDFYVIHYVLSGQGTFKNNDSTFRLTKGQGFLICPGSLTVYQADSEDPWTYCWFSFNGLKAESYLENLQLSRQSPIFNYDSDSFLEDCIMNMISAKNMMSGRNFYIQSKMYMFFYKLAEHLNTPVFTAPRKGIGELYVNKAVDFIKSNYAENITIQELADYIGISRKHLFRLFKEYLHISPQNYLIGYRINKACELLVNPALSIHDISQSVGYTDQLLFSKVFKRIKAVSPRDYRNLNR